MREELVGTVGGSGTCSATRVASWIRHVATACAKGITKKTTYSPIYFYDYYYDYYDDYDDYYDNYYDYYRYYDYYDHSYYYYYY